MPLQVVETPKPHLTYLADIRFLVAMSEQVALQIMVSRELGVAVVTFVFLGGGRPGHKIGILILGGRHREAHASLRRRHRTTCRQDAGI